MYPEVLCMSEEEEDRNSKAQGMLSDNSSMISPGRVTLPGGSLFTSQPAVLLEKAQTSHSWVCSVWVTETAICLTGHGLMTRFL